MFRKLLVTLLLALPLSLASWTCPALGQDTDTQPLTATVQKPKRPDRTRAVFYRNKLEFSYEIGYLPINIPLIWDVFLNSRYSRWPLRYTLVPNIASLRWQVDGIHGPWFLRGSTDFAFSGSFTAIPRGAETRYAAFDFGIRRNFIPRNWWAIPYFEIRGGVGDINAKGPLGVTYAQGQDLTFTNMVGSGVRFDFNPKYSFEAGATYMHVSNADLSEPKVTNFGINVWGPIFGFNVRLGKAKPALN